MSDLARRSFICGAKINLEPAEGFEPTTYCLQNSRSNQLSYAGVFVRKRTMRFYHNRGNLTIFVLIYIHQSVIMLFMAKKSKRKILGMVSEESGIRIYYTKKNARNTPDKLSLRKYDPRLRKHVIFTETKKNLGRNEVKPKK